MGCWLLVMGQKILVTSEGVQRILVTGDGAKILVTGGGGREYWFLVIGVENTGDW